MGTNYYIRPDVCEHCGCSRAESIHIGKSSYGWKFCFNGTDRKTKGEWYEFLDANRDKIYNEYGEKQNLLKFKTFIESKADGLDDAKYVKIHPEHYEYRNTDEWTDGTFRFHPGEFS